MSGELDPVERVALVQRLWEAWRVGQMDDATATMHPDVVWRPITRPARTEYRGPAGVRQMRLHIEQLRGEMDLRVDEILATEGDTVRATGSVQFPDDADRTPFAVVFSFRDGLICFVETVYGRE